MKREVCEEKLLALLEAAEGVYRAYAPGGRGLCMIANSGQMDVIGFGTDISVTRFADGTMAREAAETA